MKKTPKLPKISYIFIYFAAQIGFHSLYTKIYAHYVIINHTERRHRKFFAQIYRLYRHSRPPHQLRGQPKYGLVTHEIIARKPLKADFFHVKKSAFLI